MIRHIVLVQFTEGTSDAKAESLLDGLRDLKRVLPGMRSISTGANVSTEGLSRGATHAVTIDFDDAAARDAYLIHPDHEAAGARIVAAAERGIDSVTVVDIEI